MSGVELFAALAVFGLLAMLPVCGAAWSRRREPRIPSPTVGNLRNLLGEQVAVLADPNHWVPRAEHDALARRVEDLEARYAAQERLR